MKRKLFGIMLAFVMCVSVTAFTGCADPFSDGEDGKENVKNKVTIQVGILNEPGERETMRKFKSAFEKVNSQVNIRITYFPGTYEQAMATYIRDPKSMPDIVWTGADKHAAFSSAGHFVDLRPYYERSEETSYDKYYASMLETTHYGAGDKGIWYAPRDYNKPVTFINKTMLRQAGLEVPKAAEWNYERFIKLCNELRSVMDNEDNNSEAQRRAGLVKNSVPCDGDLIWGPVYIPYVKHFGGSLVDGKNVNIKSSASIAAYEKIHEAVSNRLISNPQTDTADSFLKKNAAMWFTVRPRMRAVENSGIEFDFLPLPFDYAGVGNSGYAITTKATERVSSNIAGNTKSNAEYAWEFIKFIITEPGQEVFGEMGTGVPVLKSLAATGKWRSYYSSEINHEAFIGEESEDVSINIYSEFPASKQFDATTAMNGLFTEIGKESNWTNGKANGAFNEKLNEIYNKLTSYLG